MIPEINKTYNCFNEGKIRLYRLYKVTITEIIPFNMVDDELKKKWLEETKPCYWLYKESTDYLIKAIDKNGETEVFARTKNDGWFSIGDFMNCGRLDITGELTEFLNHK